MSARTPRLGDALVINLGTALLFHSRALALTTRRLSRRVSRVARQFRPRPASSMRAGETSRATDRVHRVRRHRVRRARDRRARASRVIHLNTIVIVRVRVRRRRQAARRFRPRGYRARGRRHLVRRSRVRRMLSAHGVRRGRGRRGDARVLLERRVLSEHGARRRVWAPSRVLREQGRKRVEEQGAFESVVLRTVVRWVLSERGWGKFSVLRRERRLLPG